MSPSADTRRPENLALLFQDVLTAIVRLRSNRQGVIDAAAFRHQIREALKNAASRALSAGYTADDTRHATFAAVAFLDESVLNSRNPIFAEWLRKPLQAELFGTHTAGEEFFVSLQQLLGRGDSADLADLMKETPQLVKVCTPPFVRELVNRALPGMLLTHLPIPPPAISTRAETQYFGISRTGPCWNHMLQTRQVGVYVPGEFPNPELQVLVVLDT